MAKTIAKAWGEDSSRVKETHRLGSKSASVEAATWRTFAYATVNADGSGWVQIKRDGKEIHSFDFGPETVANWPQGGPENTETPEMVEAEATDRDAFITRI